MKILVALILALLSTSASAQQQPRPATAVEMNGAMQAAIEQGNIARSMHIQAEAKAAGLADELTKAQARIKELETPKEEPKK